MNIAVLFATIEGQTGKIARFLQEEIANRGHVVRLVDTQLAEQIDLDGIDRVVLAAPVHQRRHPERFEATLLAFADRLASVPTMLLSVSLSAAFEGGREEAQDFVDEMKMRTGLNPTSEALVAGAIRAGSYDYFARQVVRFVLLRGRDVDPSGDHEFTDWDALRSDLDAFLASGA